MITAGWVFVVTMVGSSLAVIALTIADALKSRKQPADLWSNSKHPKPDGNGFWIWRRHRLAGAFFFFCVLVLASLRLS